MAYDGDNSQHQSTVESENAEIIRLLKAILMGIEMIAGQDDLIDNIEE